VVLEHFISQDSLLRGSKNNEPIVNVNFIASNRVLEEEIEAYKETKQTKYMKNFWQYTEREKLIDKEH